MTDPTPNTTPWNRPNWEEEPEAPKLNAPIVPCWMTKREYFAAMAMIGLLSAERDSNLLASCDIADIAVDQAEQLIERLEK